ncbi:MAG TPA: SHOCT domain-containing protein [Cellulomonas sp.]|uniref:SHOCT domain-containing protein n=1 Tax=Cellulomonas sp. TaxID=40001 RepID=UPI002E2F8E15|nr:SHOCT domain-containing protein [Cellulomonas sp.]HEX5331829.1 SHOCT domain-containing protein [Cellulomonas sp.]
MHPFYAPSSALLERRSTLPLGLLSMASYLVFWAVAIPVALRMLRRVLDESSRPRHAVGHPPGDPDPAVAVLRERYARGEIEDDEFRRRVRVLGD